MHRSTRLVGRSSTHSSRSCRCLTPFRVATWAIVVCGLLLGASAAGVQVAPLLMVTGWGSVLAGLASQQLLANAVSGVQMVGGSMLYTGAALLRHGAHGHAPRAE